VLAGLVLAASFAAIKVPDQRVLAKATPDLRSATTRPTVRAISAAALSGGLPLGWMPQIAVVTE